MLAMNVNDDAPSLTERVAWMFFASKLAPTGMAPPNHSQTITLPHKANPPQGISPMSGVLSPRRLRRWRSRPMVQTKPCRNRCVDAPTVDGNPPRIQAAR